MTTLASRGKQSVTIGLKDHGKRMLLAVFDRAITTEGHAYELAKGVIEVSEIPSRLHQLILQALRDQFTYYRLTQVGQPIFYIGGGAEAKLLIQSNESERHPDLSVYLTPMPEMDQPWSIWKPEIVIEVVSPSSAKRDYQEKPAEYLALGVAEYWILDPVKKLLTIKTNQGGVWHDKTFKPTQKITSIRLPKFVFDLKKALAAGK